MVHKSWLWNSLVSEYCWSWNAKRHWLFDLSTLYQMPATQKSSHWKLFTSWNGYSANIKRALSKFGFWYFSTRQVYAIFWFSGLFDCGIVETQLNGFLTGLDIPALSTKTLKDYERIAGKALESLALESCEENLLKEIEAARAANDIIYDE